MLISVIIPIYKTEQYLRKCVDSVINCIKEYNDIEIILVNDGSPDNSKDICLEYCNKYGNIKLIDQENKGLSAARNAGIKEALGKYLAFIDSDDYVDEKFKEMIILTRQNSNIDVFMFNYNNVYSDRIGVAGTNDKLSVKAYTVDNNLRTTLFKHTNGFSPAVKFIVSKEFIIKHNLYFKLGFLHEDIDWSIRIVLHASTFYYSTINWYNYIREREGSIMNVRGYKSLSDTILLSKNLVDATNDLTDIRLKRAIRSSLSGTCYCVLKFIKPLSEENRIKIIGLIKQHFSLFSYSKKLKHRLFYCFAKTFGIKNTINLIIKIT